MFCALCCLKIAHDRETYVMYCYLVCVCAYMSTLDENVVGAVLLSCACAAFFSRA